MLVFIAEFPIAEGRPVEDVLKVVRDWLIGGRHYPWTNASQMPSVENGIWESTVEGQRLSLGAYSDGTRTICGAQHVWQESATFEWITEITGTQHASGAWVVVSVACNVLRTGSVPPMAKPPFAVRALINELGGGRDGALTVSAAPHALRYDDLQLMTDVVSGTSSCHLPVVFLSTGFDGLPALDPNQLARDLAGTAHVLVEPGRPFSRALAERTSRHNPYGGAIGLYWPHTRGRALRLLPSQFAIAEDLRAEIGTRIRLSGLYAKRSGGSTWPELIEALSRQSLESLRASGAATLDDYATAFDAEVSALRELLQQTEERLSRAMAAAPHARSGREAQGGPLVPGEEQDLFQGEITDIVINALTEAASRTDAESRRHTVLNDLLAANVAEGNAARIQQQIREVLEGTMKIGRKEICALEDAGFTVTDGKHLKAVFADDPRLTFTLYRTASDHRAPMNLISDIGRKIFR